jgi:hypothetical protein
MPEIQNPHQLSNAIAELLVVRSHTRRTLENYLICLLVLARKHKSRNTMSLDRFYRLLAESFSSSIIAFDPKWLESFVESVDENGFGEWEKAVIRQIVDLHEMQGEGQLGGDIKYVGVTSPRGNHWLNFDPCSFIESGADHFLPVVEARANQLVGSPSPDVLLAEEPVVQAISTTQSTHLTWNQFRNFMLCAQTGEMS